MELEPRGQRDWKKEAFGFKGVTFSTEEMDPQTDIITTWYKEIPEREDYGKTLWRTDKFPNNGPIRTVRDDQDLVDSTPLRSYEIMHPLSGGIRRELRLWSPSSDAQLEHAFIFPKDATRWGLNAIDAHYGADRLVSVGIGFQFSSPDADVEAKTFGDMRREEKLREIVSLFKLKGELFLTGRIDEPRHRSVDGIYDELKEETEEGKKVWWNEETWNFAVNETNRQVLALIDQYVHPEELETDERQILQKWLAVRAIYFMPDKDFESLTEGDKVKEIGECIFVDVDFILQTYLWNLHHRADFSVSLSPLEHDNIIVFNLSGQRPEPRKFTIGQAYDYEDYRYMMEREGENWILKLFDRRKSLELVRANFQDKADIRKVEEIVSIDSNNGWEEALSLVHADYKITT